MTTAQLLYFASDDSLVLVRLRIPKGPKQDDAIEYLSIYRGKVRGDETRIIERSQLIEELAIRKGRLQAKDSATILGISFAGTDKRALAKEIEAIGQALVTLRQDGLGDESH